MQHAPPSMLLLLCLQKHISLLWYSKQCWFCTSHIACVASTIMHLFNIECDINNLGKVLVTGQSIFLQFCYVGNGNVCPTVKWVHRNSSTQNHRLKVLACMCQISQDYINWKTRKAVLWKYIQLPEHKTIKNKDRLCILRLYFLTLTLGDEEKWWNKTF